MTRETTPAADLLKEVGVTRPDHIDVDAIAQFHGLTIVYAPLSGCEARLIGTGDRAFATVNSLCGAGRRRFSAAHELGHWIMDRDLLAFVCTEDGIRESSVAVKSRVEARANRFAAEFLMPSYLFRPRVREAVPNLDLILGIKEEFSTSLTAAAIRYVALSDYPVLLVVFGGTQRRWFSASPDLPSPLRPLRSPGKHTQSARLLSDTSLARLPPDDVDADELIDHPDAHLYTVREEAIRISRDVVLVLVSWPNEAQLLDLLDHDS